MKFSNPDTTSNVIWMSISGSTHREDPQLPHSYYFTTRILVLKFANKGCFLRKSRIHIFLEKRDILVLNSLNLEKKGLILMSSVYCENGIHLGWKVCVLPPKKGGSFWTEKSVFYCEKGSFWAENSVFCHKKGGHFQTGEQRWVPLFPVSERAGGPHTERTITSI